MVSSWKGLPASWFSFEIRKENTIDAANLSLFSFEKEKRPLHFSRLNSWARLQLNEIEERSAQDNREMEWAAGNGREDMSILE